jgi:hypothetical protein
MVQVGVAFMLSAKLPKRRGCAPSMPTATPVGTLRVVAVAGSPAGVQCAAQLCHGGFRVMCAQTCV